jgi:hypothetical protein
MDCLSTSVEHFILHHNINPMYSENISIFLKDANYTIYTRLHSLYVDKKISVQLIENIQDIKPHTIIGIYIKPKEYLNVFGYHYFYVDDDSIISSWYTTRNITNNEYNSLEYRPRSLSETSIENGNIEPTILSLDILYSLWNLIHNDKNDIGNDLYQLFGGTNLVNQILKKSEYKILLYMYSVDISQMIRNFNKINIC